jgi:hypothetical protein
MKVNNSKFWICLLLMMASSSILAQTTSGSFSSEKRDTEVTRITFENYLKRWHGEVLLNRFRESSAAYKSGEGMTLNVLAENAHIYMSVQGGSFENADGVIMDTFFSDAMISLQKERLAAAVKKFLVEYKNYLPTLSANENIRFVFEVKDAKRKGDGKEVPPSKLAYKRTYNMEASIAYRDFAAYKNGNSSEADFVNSIQIK